jgi:hypothetical protein
MAHNAQARIREKPSCFSALKIKKKKKDGTKDVEDLKNSYMITLLCSNYIH